MRLDPATTYFLPAAPDVALSLVVVVVVVATRNRLECPPQIPPFLRIDNEFLEAVEPDLVGEQLLGRRGMWMDAALS